MVIGYQLLRGYHGNLLYACGHCAVTVRSLCGHCAVTVRSLCGHCAVTVRSLCGHCAVTVRSLCGHCAVTMVTYSMRAVGAADLSLFFVHPAGILKG